MIALTGTSRRRVAPVDGWSLPTHFVCTAALVLAVLILMSLGGA